MHFGGRGRIRAGKDWTVEHTSPTTALAELPHADPFATLIFAAALQLVAAGWAAPEKLAHAEEINALRTRVAQAAAMQQRLAWLEQVYAAQEATMRSWTSAKPLTSAGPVQHFKLGALSSAGPVKKLKLEDL
jgi:hypothetical protein